MFELTKDNIRMRINDIKRFGRNLHHQSLWYAIGEGLNDSGLANRAYLEGIKMKLKGEYNKHKSK